MHKVSISLSDLNHKAQLFLEYLELRKNED